MRKEGPVRPTVNSFTCMNCEGGGDLHPTEEEGREEVIGGEGPREEEAEGEARAMRSPTIPITPSQAEVMQHRLQHYPFRSWCPHCVRGKGREDRHTKSGQKGEFGGIPKLASDYFYIGIRRPQDRAERSAEEDLAEKEGQTPIIVIKDVNSKALFAHACPCKGAHDLVVSKMKPARGPQTKNIWGQGRYPGGESVNR